MINETIKTQRKLTKAVHQFLKEKGLRASTAKSWKRAKRYWWNYFLVDGTWWGINVYDDTIPYIVKRIC